MEHRHGQSHAHAHGQAAGNRASGSGMEAMQHGGMAQGGMAQGGMAHGGMAMRHGLGAGPASALLGLGLWLIASPPALGYGGSALAWSDIVAGVALLVLGAAALRGSGTWVTWAGGAVGTWLLFAPLVFWSPSAAGYLNDTVIGALAIGAAILVPHGMTMPGPDVPPGWSYNPSSWGQRAPVAALALVGFLISRDMAAYQLRHVASVWDPFFGDATLRVLDSEISKMFPVSDAGLGASVYMLELLMAIMGDPRRWRTMPWMVALFGVLVIPLGVTSIVLVILQPLAVGAWCGPCLVASAAMLVMVPLTLDEVVAMLQYLAERRRAGASVWRVFWAGGESPSATDSPSRNQDASPSARRALAEMVRGVTLPWSLLAGVALGIWLLATPAMLGNSRRVADSDWLTGALVITAVAVATAEVTRAARWLNLPLGLWIALAPWILEGASPTGRWSDVVVGLLIAALAVPRGAVRERSGRLNPAAGDTTTTGAAPSSPPTLQDGHGTGHGGRRDGHGDHRP